VLGQLLLGESTGLAKSGKESTEPASGLVGFLRLRGVVAMQVATSVWTD
jgi:hypothetical protein